MKANISEELIERVATINGKPIIRGMGKAMNECLDRLQDGTCKDENHKKVESEKVESEKLDCLNNKCKEELQNNAS